MNVATSVSLEVRLWNDRWVQEREEQWTTELVDSKLTYVFAYSWR